MLGSEIVAFFNKFSDFKKHFIGVFTIDQVPTLKERQSCIVNQCNSKHEGNKHWMCFSRVDGNDYELFDSLGTTEEYVKKHFGFVDNYEGVVFFNKQQLQHPKSSSCGQMSITAAYYRMLNYDLDFFELLNEYFSVCPARNEKNVTDLFYQYQQDG